MSQLWVCARISVSPLMLMFPPRPAKQSRSLSIQKNIRVVDPDWIWILKILWIKIRVKEERKRRK
jgi:hypothetical protein